jgi:hypothetical protein
LNRRHEDFQSTALPTELPGLTILFQNLFNYQSTYADSQPSGFAVARHPKGISSLSLRLSSRPGPARHNMACGRKAAIKAAPMSRVKNMTFHRLDELASIFDSGRSPFYPVHRLKRKIIYLTIQGRYRPRPAPPTYLTMRSWLFDPRISVLLRRWKSGICAYDAVR